MRTPTLAGQYRRVRYTDDGCSVYSCCWCDRTVEVRDDPQYGWNFCPKCGKSWFVRLQCREHDTPRWWYDRFNDNPDARVKLSSGEEVGIYSLKVIYPRIPERKSKWVFERSVKWKTDILITWEVEFRENFDPIHNYLWAKRQLNMFRLHTKGEELHYQYRARLERV